MIRASNRIKQDDALSKSRVYLSLALPANNFSPNLAGVIYSSYWPRTFIDEMPVAGVRQPRLHLQISISAELSYQGRGGCVGCGRAVGRGLGTGGGGKSHRGAHKAPSL